MSHIKTEAILWLQSKLAVCENPYWTSVYELALELATAPNSTRTVNQYYLTNLLSDAKKTLKRKRDRFNPVSLTTIAPWEEPTSPFQHARFLVTDLEQAILQKCSHLPEYTPQLLSLLTHGYNSRGIAERLGISPSYARRLIASVREVAFIICLN